MGKVTDYIIEQIKKQVEQKGIVVWYDPEESYKDLIKDLTIPGADILRFEDSFFRLRHDIEPYLEFIEENGLPAARCGEPPGLVVYVPEDRTDTEHALIEVESAGTVMEPGASPWQKNTRLKVIADHVFKQLIPDGAAEICRQVDEGLLNLKELDILSDEAEGIASGTVKLIFSTVSAKDVALGFVATNDFDEDIISKYALIEMLNIFHIDLGISLEKETDLKSVKRSLWKSLFTAELLHEFPKEKRPGQLSHISIPKRQIQVNSVKEICRTWRQRMDYIPAYKEAANAIELELSLNRLPMPVEIISHLETFPVLENRLLEQAEQWLLEAEAEQALNLARKRMGMFWAAQEPIFQLNWKLLENSANIKLLCMKINTALKQEKFSPRQLVKCYSKPPESWCDLDTFYRRLESGYANFELGHGGEHDQLEKVIFHIRKSYNETVNQLIEVFTIAFSEQDFKVKGTMKQSEIFNEFVLPLINKYQKISYILVDALRYEMAGELVAGLKENFDVVISPGIGGLPSITTIGMAALLPGAEKGLQLVEGKGGKIIPAIGNTHLKDRPGRLKYMESQIEKNVVTCKLNELIKPDRKRKDQLEQAEIIVVTSGEIDRWGEEADDEAEVRLYMDEVLDKLRKGIRRLASYGVSQFVITADHGHLFGESIESGMRMEPPGGETLELHRRFWIGKGGKSAPGFIRTPLSRLGYDSDLEIAFPKAFSCFVTRGGSISYLHGGISLQELVIPIIRLETKRTEPVPLRAVKVKLSMSSPQITTRLFSIIIDYSVTELFGPQELRIKTVVKSGDEEVGTVALSAYGFEEGAREIMLKKGETNSIVFMLNQLENIETVSVYVLESTSLVELAKIENIQVNISL